MQPRAVKNERVKKEQEFESAAAQETDTAFAQSLVTAASGTKTYKVIKLSREPAFWHATSIDQRSKDIRGTHAKHVVQGNGSLSHCKSVDDNAMDDGKQS